MKLMALLFVVLSTFTPGFAEIMVGDSAEWVAHESDLIILATPLAVENFKGPGEVRFTKTRFRVDEIIKGGASAGDVITIFDYSYNKEDVLGLEQAKQKSGQLLIYAIIAAHTFPETDGRYLFTHADDFKSAFHAGRPVDHLFTPEFKPLTDFAETLERTRKQVGHEARLKDLYWRGVIREKQLEVPYDSEAFRCLYGGSSCYISIPDYVDPVPTR